MHKEINYGANNKLGTAAGRRGEEKEEERMGNTRWSKKILLEFSFQDKNEG